jgi:hypothetical protein
MPFYVTAARHVRSRTPLRCYLVRIRKPSFSF